MFNTRRIHRIDEDLQTPEPWIGHGLRDLEQHLAVYADFEAYWTARAEGRANVKPAGPQHRKVL